MNLLHIGINWPQLKSLHQVYEKGSTRSNLFNNPYFERLRKDRRVLRYKSNNRSIIEGTSLFKEFYQQTFLAAYQRYDTFFTQTGVQSDGRRPYRLYDLETLMYIQNNKAELVGNLTTERTFASQVFNSSKYLENNSSVRNAVLQIFGVDQFPKRDPKEHIWRLIVDCPVPKMILLCENLDTLKCPDLAIALGVELWYVGGNNIAILKNLSQDKLRLPIYYRCDWDYDGLRIYGNVVEILKGKDKNIPILEPSDISRRLPVDSPYHNSRWKIDRFFSGLNKDIFDQKQRTLIEDLINSSQWIEEESQDLEKLLQHNGCLV
jgi:hypothetical protein